MFGRIIVGWLLASWIVFGSTTSVWGQVELHARLEEIAAAEDRYGGYEPADFAQDGPQLLPPAKTRGIQTHVVSQAAPLPNPTRGDDFLPSPATVPPMTSSPMMMPAYASPPVGHRCPPWRPCGPQESFGMNWFVLQGFAGADFRPACAHHDACLMSKCYPRKVCDRMFLADMDNACNCSQFPLLCRLEARKCYLGVRLFGWMF